MNDKGISFLLSLLLGSVLGGSVLILSAKAPVFLVGGIGVVVMALFPIMAYYALVATIPVAVGVIGGLTVTKLVSPLVLVLLGLNALAHRCRLRNPLRQTEGQLGLLFFGALFLSIFFARDPAATAKAALVALVFATLFFITLALVDTVEGLKRLIWVLILVGVAEAIIAAAQIQFEFVFPDEWREHMGTMGGGGAVLGALEEGKVRVEGTTSHPLVLSGFLQVVIPFGVAQLFLERRLWMKTLLLGGTALMAYAWFYTFSRSSMAAMGVMGVCTLTLTSKLGRYLAIALGVTAVVAFLIYQVAPHGLIELVDTLPIVRRLFRGADVNPAGDSFMFRVESWIGGWNLFLDHFFFGVGYGQAIDRYIPYLPFWTNPVNHPVEIHNVFIEVACEIGILGVLAFIGLWGRAFHSLHKAQKDPHLGPYARTVLVVFSGLLVLLSMIPMIRELWLLFAMAAVIGRIHQEHRGAL